MPESQSFPRNRAEYKTCLNQWEVVHVLKAVTEAAAGVVDMRDLRHRGE
jgi:hypothetical protein